MNANLISLIAFAGGAILIYAAIKDKDPRQVIKEALGQKPAKADDKKGGTQPSSYDPSSPYYGNAIPV